MKILLTEDFHYEHTLEIKLNEAALDDLLPLLKEMKRMGSIGQSKTIKIEDYGREDDERDTFGFDGDGPSRIISIKLDGKDIENKKKDEK